MWKGPHGDMESSKVTTMAVRMGMEDMRDRSNEKDRAREKWKFLRGLMPKWHYHHPGQPFWVLNIDLNPFMLITPIFLDSQQTLPARSNLLEIVELRKPQERPGTSSPGPRH